MQLSKATLSHWDTAIIKDDDDDDDDDDSGYDVPGLQTHDPLTQRPCPLQPFGSHLYLSRSLIRSLISVLRSPESLTCE